MAEWSKALVLGTSHISGVGSNPTPVIFLLQKIILQNHSDAQKYYHPVLSTNAIHMYSKIINASFQCGKRNTMA